MCPIYSYFIILPCLTPDNFTRQGESAGQFKLMLVYLVFLQVAKKNLQLALRGPNLPASLEACKLRQGTRHWRNFFELCFILYQNWVPANLLKPNCSRLFIYQADKIVGCWIKFGHGTGNFKFLMASFDEFTSWVRLLLNLVGKYCKMYLEKLKFSSLLKHA
jgi:hypothetical protein